MMKHVRILSLCFLLCSSVHAQISQSAFGTTEWTNGPQALSTQPYPTFGLNQTMKPGWIRQWDTYSNWPYLYFYSTGFVSVQGGSTQVVGSNTGWDASVVGSALTLHSDPGVSATVASVTDAEHLTLTTPWAGSKVSDGSYLLNLTRGHYNWTQLDQVLDYASGNEADLLYTFQMIPSWVTGNHTDPNCHRSDSAGYGTCYAPADLYTVATCQGSLAGTVTTDCMVKEFVTDLMNHAKNRGTPIRFIELGNEVPICSSNYGSCPAQSQVGTDGEWSGAIADHVVMSGDVVAIARQIEPDVTIIAPSINNVNDGTITNPGPAWIAAWLDGGGTELVDAISFHGYLGAVPEPIATTVANFQAVLDAHGASGKPLWDTEESWGGIPATFNAGYSVTQISRTGGTVSLSTYPVQHNFNLGDMVTVAGNTSSGGFNGTFTVASVPSSYTITYAQATPDATGTGTGTASNETAQSNFLARRLLVELSAGVERADWYAYASNTNPPETPGALCLAFTAVACTQLRLAGQTYGEIMQWVIGTSSLGPCSVSGTVWSCDFAGANNLLAKAVWDTAGSSSYTVPAGYVQYQPLSGPTVAISGGTIQIGLTPILLENQPSSALTAKLVLSTQSGTAPLAVTADSSSSTDTKATIVSYSLNFGDGTVLSGPQATHTYTNPGTYTITAIVRDSANASASTSAKVSVSGITPPSNLRAQSH